MLYRIKPAHPQNHSHNYKEQEPEDEEDDKV